MFELVLIRHGEAEGQENYLGRRSDPPLTGEGRKGTEQLKERLLTDGLLPADDVPMYSSPQKRALETAGILLGDETPEVIDEFAEMDFGDWDGLNWQEISSLASDDYRSWLENPANASPPNGETMNEFMERVDRGLEIVLERGEGRSIITAHGGVIRAVICNLLKLPVKYGMSFDVDNSSCSIIKLYQSETEGKSAVLTALNLK